MAKLIAIVGSPRVDGNTSYLTDQALEEAGKLGIETEKIILAQYKINPCQAHGECWNSVSCLQEDDMELIARKLYEADGIILSSPVYFYNVTAQMKAFIDRNVFYYRRDRRMKARCASIIVVAGGGGVEDTANALIRFITISSNIRAEKVRKVHGFAGAEGAIRSNAASVELARGLGRNMAKELLKR